MNLAEIVLDNPILIKHVRSRLRPRQVVPGAFVVLVLAACTSWCGSFIPWFGNESAVMVLLGLQILILALAGANQINASLGGARESGILNFHRVTPVPPALLALGYFLGAPIREYVMAAVTVPFAIYSASEVDPVSPWRGLLWLAQLEVAILTTSWLIHAIAMLGCLTRKKPRGSIQGTFAMIFLLIFFGGYGSAGFYFGARWLLEESRAMNFFGFMVPWLAWLLIYELPPLGFLGLAAARKLKAERTHAYSKPQALAFMAGLTLLLLGGIWKIARLLDEAPPVDPTPVDVIMIAVVYALASAAIVLALTITPGLGEYVKALRRVRRAGARRPSPWSDAGSNRMALFLLCALVFLGATATVHVVGRQPPHKMEDLGIPTLLLHAGNLDDQAWLRSRQAMMSRPIVIAVLTVAYAGLALQYFSLRTRSSGLVLSGVFLFLAWLGPLLAGTILGLSGAQNERLIVPILALSPLAGIALSSGIGQPPEPDAIQLAALAPAITFAFVFNYLLVVLQRKVDRTLHASEKTSALPEKALGPVVDP